MESPFPQKKNYSYTLRRMPPEVKAFLLKRKMQLDVECVCNRNLEDAIYSIVKQAMKAELKNAA